MNNDRYNTLMDWHCMNAEEVKLTHEECEAGWHFCPDWDFLLVGPGMKVELECCCCHFDSLHGSPTVKKG